MFVPSMATTTSTKLDKRDLKLMGFKVLSNTPKVDFVVNGN